MESGLNNKVKALCERLREDIEAGVYQKGEKLPSVRALAEKHLVNKGTVVTVLAALSSEGLVRTEAGKGAYVLEPKKEAKQIAVLFFDDAAPIRADTEVLRCIQQTIRSDYFISLHDTSQDYKVFENKIRDLIENGISGIIAIPPKFYTPKPAEVERLNNLLLKSVPLVFIIRNIEGVDADFYSMDLQKGMEKAVSYLKSLNKKHICIVKHDSKKFVDEELMGLNSACSRLGIEVDEKFILEHNYQGGIDGLTRSISAILPEIDSIIAPDFLLCSMQEIFRRSGKRIPEDLAVIGINDMMSPYFFPPLTSLRFPVESIGSYAANTVMMRIEGTMPEKKQTKNFIPELIIRET